MMIVFNYKQKVFPKVLLFVIFGAFALIIDNYQLYSSVSFYLAFILLQAIIHIYYSSKRLIITDSGIEEKIFWDVPYSTVKWESMEEACEIINDPKTANSSSQTMEEPFAVIRWFTVRSIGNMIKIIVTNEEPLYLHLKDIKNSPELTKLLRERIRFVK